MLVDSEDKEISRSYTPPRSTSPERELTEREASSTSTAAAAAATTTSPLKETNDTQSPATSSNETLDANSKINSNHFISLSSPISQEKPEEEESESFENQPQQSVQEHLKKVTSQTISNTKSNCTESHIESKGDEEEDQVTVDETINRPVKSPVLSCASSNLHLSSSSGSVALSQSSACSLKLPSDMNLSLDTRVVNSSEPRVPSPCLSTGSEGHAVVSTKGSTGSSICHNAASRVSSPCLSSESEGTAGEASANPSTGSKITVNSVRNNSPVPNEMMPTIANDESNWLVDKKRRRLMSSSYGSSSASSSASSPPCISPSDDSEDGGCISDSGCDSVSVLDLSLPARKRANDTANSSSGHVNLFNASLVPQHHTNAHQVSRSSNTGSSFAALSAVAAAALANALAASSSSSSPVLSEDISVRRARRDRTASGLCDSEHEVEGEIRANPKKSLIRRYCEYSVQSDSFFQSTRLHCAHLLISHEKSTTALDTRSFLSLSFFLPVTCQLTSTCNS